MQIKFSLLLFLFLILFSNRNLNSQEAWSLQQCVDYALENNVNLKMTALNQDFAQNTLLQTKMDIYTPFVNAGVTHNFNFSNSVDPLTFQFVNQNTQSTVYALNANFSVFEGMSRVNNMRANKNELTATELEIEEAKNQTRLSVTNLYLQILVAEEVLKIAEERLKLTKVQFKNTNELVKSGVLARGDLLEVEAQMANEELSIVNAENNVVRAYNQLKNLLQLPPFEPFDIQKVDFQDKNDFNVNPELLINRAFVNMPNLLGAEFRMQAAEQKLRAARGSLAPSLSLSGRIGTNYFSLAQQRIGEQSTGPIPVGVVGSTGDVVFTEQNIPLFGDLSYGQQFERNVNESFSVNLSIPIFGKWQRMISIDNAKINIINAEYTIESKKIQLQEEVFNAYTEAKAAGKRLEAANKSVEASELAFDFANEKQKAGVINSVELETVKNRLINAQAEYVQAKYEFAFRKMIVNFYDTGELNF